ncbi:MAG: formylglycine-generating enzyme family protein [Planctomycetaceae bacterium]
MHTRRESLRYLAGLVGAVVGGASARVQGQPQGAGKTTGMTPGEERNDNGLGMKLAWCPAGTFTMGSPKSEVGRYEDEEQVEVTLTEGFWIGKYEVTQGEWESVMGTTPWQGEKSVKQDPKCAATYVCWDDAIEFASRLTRQERAAGRLPAGWSYSLPTEAQWEYACRAGTTTVYSFGNKAGQLSEFDWWQGNTGQQQYAHEVGSRKPNPWGLYDLHGNVAEWCWDGYEKQLPGGTDPRVNPQGMSRVFRGGAWRYRAEICRTAARRNDTPGVRSRSNRLGLRVILSGERREG